MTQMRLSKEEFAELVQQAIELLPPQFLERMENMSVDIQPRPSRELLRKEDLEGQDDLLGLYVGVPLTHRSVEAPYRFPEKIIIFQRNIEQICRNRQEIVEEVRLTVLHEIAHHFGFDDPDLEDLGYG